MFTAINADIQQSQLSYGTENSQGVNAAATNTALRILGRK